MGSKPSSLTVAALLLRELRLLDVIDDQQLYRPPIVHYIDAELLLNRLLQRLGVTELPREHDVIGALQAGLVEHWPQQQVRQRSRKVRHAAARHPQTHSRNLGAADPHRAGR